MITKMVRGWNFTELFTNGFLYPLPILKGTVILSLSQISDKKFEAQGTRPLGQKS